MILILQSAKSALQVLRAPSTNCPTRLSSATRPRPKAYPNSPFQPLYGFGTNRHWMAMRPHGFFEGRREFLKPIVLKRGEFGRGRDLPAHRLVEIDAVCAAHNVKRHQALSFRRQLLRSRPGGMRRVNQSNCMGDASGMQHVATLFENAVGDYLRNLGVAVLDERVQRAKGHAEGRRCDPTPDFLFVEENGRLVFINSRRVNWVECKLYYGTCSLASTQQLPIGKISAVVARYDAAYGPGAVIFGQGYCADLKDILPSALLLDPSPPALNMSSVSDFQNAQN